MGSNSERSSNYGIIYRTLHGKPFSVNYPLLNHDLFSSELFDEPIFRQCAQSTKCHFDEVTFRRNGSLDEVSHFVLSKLIEKFIQKHLMAYLNSFDVLHKYQSGFRSGHSTETALILMTEGWLKAINEGKFVGTIMVDFRKAFDLVDNDLLLKKLSYYKSGSNFINLMKSYLKNRTQVVSVNGTKSNTAEISSGVQY